MRPSLLSAAICLSLLSVPVPCLADTVFNLQNVELTNGTTASGTVVINTATGVFDSADIMSTQGTQNYVFDTLSYQQENFDSQSYAYFGDSLGDYFILDLPVASLVGYSGSTLCTTTTTCDGFVSGLMLANGSSLAASTGAVATSVTPEPSSFVLLGTGLLGVTGVVRKRFA